MFSTAEFSMIHLNALTFNQILYIIFIISISVLSINALLKVRTFISYKKYGNITNIASICYFIMYFGILALVGYITFIASNVMLF
jgi:hypothetical protein